MAAHVWTKQSARGSVSKPYLSIPGATTANNSLFTYPEGKSHQSYFGVNYTPNFLDEGEPVFTNATLGQQARAVCGDNKQCLFDIQATGNVNIGRASRQAAESFIAVVNDTESVGEHTSFLYINEPVLLNELMTTNF